MSSADNSPAAPAFDEAQLALMTPEERDAITDTGYSADELATMGKLAAGAVDEDDGEPDETLDEHGRPVETVIVPAKDAAGEIAAQNKPAGDAAADAVLAPAPAHTAAQSPYQATLPADFDQKLQAAQQKIDDIWAEFDGGGMERSALQARLREAESEKSNLDSLRLKSEIAGEMTVQAAQVAWQKSINDLFDTSVKTGGVDYSTDEAKRNDLDHFVKALASDVANEDKPMGWFLAEADKRVRALHGVALTPAVKDIPAIPTKVDAVAEALAKRKPSLALVPKTLAQVPGGEGPGDVGSEFAHLDALEGADLENAVARMSPLQREKFARGG